MDIQKIIQEAVKDALREQLDRDPDLDPVGKTEKGKKVGVGQIRDVDNDGDIDSSDAYLAHRRKKISQNIDKEDLNENEYYKKSTNWGEIPDEEELEELMGGEGFDMNLKGADSLAWDYAMALSEDPRAGSTSDATGMRASLLALTEAPSPDEISDDDYEDVEFILDEWYEKYESEEIQEVAWNLASSMMEVLGVEWI